MDSPILTADGSHTLFSQQFQAHYHSLHGAMQESNHVFIQHGLGHYCQNNPTSETINILELGFGTGLNALLAYQYAQEHRMNLRYTAIEQFPISLETAAQLNYPRKEILMQMHEVEWEKEVEIPKDFYLIKHQADLKNFSLPTSHFQLVFFDAFSPSEQPELWTLHIFEKLFEACTDQALLVTYCAKGEVRRNMQKAGFAVERIPGPPGKREMLRATKNS